MPEKPRTYISETFDILKAGLGPYILSKYKTKYRANYIDEIKQYSRDFKKLPTEEKALLEFIDTQGWLDLILNNWPLFKEDLDHEGRTQVNELMTCRNKLAHEEPLSFNDAYRTADTVARLLKTVKASEASRQARDMASTLLRLLQKQADKTKPRDITPKLGSRPPRPDLVVGRTQALQDLKSRLGIIGINGRNQGALQVLTAVRGWPGVGKTTVAATIAHDPDLDKAFPNGVLWASLGERPDTHSELLKWGQELNLGNLGGLSSEEIRDRLTTVLHDKKMLLIIDDVWQAEQAVPFKVGGRGCATLVTTRFLDVARELAPKAEDIYKLEVLSDGDSLELLKKLAPAVVAKYLESSRELVRELEGLPLAIQVAGRWLNEEASLGSAGLSITDILSDIREGTELLKKKAPSDRTDLANQTTPTVAVLFKRSTDRLDETTRMYFAYLGDNTVPKPATFSLNSLAALWEVQDPTPIVRTLVNRGLLETVGDRFQMHALLVMHAKSLFEEE